MNDDDPLDDWDDEHRSRDMAAALSAVVLGVCFCVVVWKVSRYFLGM